MSKFHKSSSGTGWSFDKVAPKGFKLYHVMIEGKHTNHPKPVYYFMKKR